MPIYLRFTSQTQIYQKCNLGDALQNLPEAHKFCFTEIIVERKRENNFMRLI